MSLQHLSWICSGCLFVGLIGCSGSSKGTDDSQVGGTSSGSGGATSGGTKAQTSSNASGATSAAAGRASGGAVSSSVGGVTSSSIGGNASIGGANGVQGGTPSFGGNVSQGGTSIGGATGKGGSAGTAMGGAAGKGGTATGGAAGKGGAATGGAAGKGGAATGGAATGGAAGKGGASTGGAATGGAATGGAATGGATTGGLGNVPAGNPDGHCTIPAAAQLEDVSSPTHVIGSGTPASCTSAEVVKQVALGGIITFNCGPDPITISLTQTAKIVNTTGPKIVIDGGGKVTLSGQNSVRILYQDTCDAVQGLTGPQCQNQDTPQLTVQNLTFINGKAADTTDGGGAIYASGGHLKIVNSRFFNNSCIAAAQDRGGAAVRASNQFNRGPVYVVNSTFGGRSDLGNTGANGGGVASIDVSWTIINSLFSYNAATGNGGNPAQTGTPGGGSGGAIYNDGTTMTLSLCGTLIENNTVNAFGGAIFFVSNTKDGTVNITDSIIRNNTGGSWYPNYPGISNDEGSSITVVNSTITD